ncbi:MAG: hypothetical protein WC671_00765 [Candidatus Paceibacterota bacterium]|jgi:hypothetical protein
MNEKAPKEDIYSVPDDFKFEDYFNEFIGFALTFKNGINFNEVLRDLKHNPIITTEEYLNNPNTKVKDDYKQKQTEFKTYPQKMSRLNQIVKEINSLKENEESEFKDLINETHRLLSKDSKLYLS